MDLNTFPIGLPEILVIVVIAGGLYLGYRLLFRSAS
jgi:hypothetical protein